MEEIFIPRSENDNDKPINKELLNFQMKAIISRLDKIDQRLENSDTKYVTSKDFGELDKRVEKLESNQSRVVWIVLTAVIMAVLATIIITR